MRIAIVGSGISGLVCAHVLQREHEVTVYESEGRLGGHTHTVDVEAFGERHAVDTGFIVYNETTYPNFVRLLDELAVETQPSDMSFGMSCERTGLEWASGTLANVLAQPTNVFRARFRSMVRDILRFNREAEALLDSGDEKVTLGDYLCGAGYGQPFVDHYLVPMGAAIWSTDPARFLEFPATTFVGFFRNHGLLSTKPSLRWRVVKGGSRSYVDALTRPLAHRIRLGDPVSRILRQDSGVEIHSRYGQAAYDHVILACHSDQALALLADPEPVERTVLSAIRYQRNDVVLHTDESVLAARPRARASWNYRVTDDDPARVLVTYDMTRLQSLPTEHRFLVTLNDGGRVDESKVLRRFVYQHPVFDAAAIRAQRLHGRVSGIDRTHFCGAYWSYGFHEDGVRSALRVCRDLGVEWPS
jgi:predicted NAD/FAD-binding protein